MPNLSQSRPRLSGNGNHEPKKAGFTQEGYLRSRLPGPNGVRTDDIQYVLLPQTLLARAASDPG